MFRFKDGLIEFIRPFLPIRIVLTRPACRSPKLLSDISLFVFTNLVAFQKPVNFPAKIMYTSGTVCGTVMDVLED